MICDGSIFSLSPPPLSSLSVSYSLPRHHPPPRLTGGGAISFSSKAQFLMVTRSSAQHLQHLLTSRCSVQEKSSTAEVHSVSPAAAVLRERAKCAGVAAVYVVALRWALPFNSNDSPHNNSMAVLVCSPDPLSCVRFWRHREKWK